jgi:hypothetical protein
VSQPVQRPLQSSDDRYNILGMCPSVGTIIYILNP